MCAQVDYQLSVVIDYPYYPYYQLLSIAHICVLYVWICATYYCKTVARKARAMARVFPWPW